MGVKPRDVEIAIAIRGKIGDGTDNDEGKAQNRQLEIVRKDTISHHAQHKGEYPSCDYKKKAQWSQGEEVANRKSDQQRVIGEKT
ncbi:hypothetical protein THIOM_002916 [Candidatus Thiomargarita nelsonii]|uniref:Uncharacterized protein n=1 Tax=Candidatus Thiomargarita nelsonii TaxID=1003181 RepID=A0A176RZT5_9GAMM|nr:hypothetical protein THIOM_002916 [Candidatus Thiomargarita nelsonii]